MRRLIFPDYVLTCGHKTRFSSFRHHGYAASTCYFPTLRTCKGRHGNAMRRETADEKQGVQTPLRLTVSPLFCS